MKNRSTDRRYNGVDGGIKLPGRHEAPGLAGNSAQKAIQTRCRVISRLLAPVKMVQVTKQIRLRPGLARVLSWSQAQPRPRPRHHLCRSRSEGSAAWIDAIHTNQSWPFEQRDLPPRFFLPSSSTFRGSTEKPSGGAEEERTTGTQEPHLDLTILPSSTLVSFCRCESGCWGSGGRDGLHGCAVYALRQQLQLRLPEEAPEAWGGRGQRQGVHGLLQCLLLAAAATTRLLAGRVRLQHGGVRAREGGWEPERGVAGRRADQGRGHLPPEEGVDRLRREGHRRADQHLLRRADGVRGRERDQLGHRRHVDRGVGQHGGRHHGHRALLHRRGVGRPPPGGQEPAAGAGARLLRPASQLLHHQVQAGAADGRGVRRHACTPVQPVRRGVCAHRDIQHVVDRGGVGFAERAAAVVQRAGGGGQQWRRGSH